MLRDTCELGSALWIAGLASLPALAACTAPHKLISARHIACPVRKVEVRDLVTQPQREDWIAICGGQSYACFTREQGHRLVYGCRPLAAPSAPDAGSAAPASSSVSTPVFTPDSAVEAGAPEASTP